MINIRNLIRLLWSIVLALTPLIAIIATPFVEGFHKFSKQAWLPWFNILFVVLALYFFALPFLIKAQIKKDKTGLRFKGIDSSRLLLSLGVGGAASVSMGALFMFAYIGNSFNWVYFWAAISLPIGLYWCWRFYRSFA